MASVRTAWSALPCVLAAVTIALLSADTRAGTPAPDAGRLSREWKRLETPSLSVIGNAHESELRKVGLEMERFRRAIGSMFPGIRLDAPVPTTVYVFRDDGAFTPFKPRARGRVIDNVAGYFSSLPHANYMVLAPTGNKSFTFQVIFHEYTHYLVNRNFKRLPLWLNEGFAEFYGTFSGHERDGRTIVGRPIDWHVATLLQRTPMPLAKFIRPQTSSELYRDPRGTQLFYAQSWALTHFLLVGNNGARRAQFGRFVAAVERGAPMDAAFTEIFGPDLSVLDRELNAHISNFQLQGVQLQPHALDVKAAAAPMREADAQHAQGDLLVHTGARELADRHLASALALDPAHVGARLSRAMLRLQEDRGPEALEIMRAPDMEQAPDAVVHYVRGEALRGDEQYAAAADAYRRALALQPESPFAQYGLSITQVALGADAAAAESFARCMDLRPWPYWHLRRVQDVLRLGLDTFVVSDARSYRDATGWTGPETTYALLPEAMALLRTGDKATALEVLAEIEANVKRDSWQAALVSFFRGQLTADQLIAKAKRDDGLLTEAHAYAGILAGIAGDREKAATHLAWVTANGRKDYVEYGFAVGEQRRMARAAASSGP
jgi:lipoprotein NlpI